MADWLELELAHQLAPVEAPDELWGRVREARNPAPSPRPRRSPALWLAAAAMVVATAGAIWLFGASPSGAPSPNRVSAQASCYACHTTL
jgi:ferric-dicitrate binding protein FerR (iron transport regulator)